MELSNIGREPLMRIAMRMKEFNRMDCNKRKLEIATVCLNLYENMENVFRAYGIKAELDIMDGFDCFIFENEFLLDISLEALAYKFIELLDTQGRITLRVVKHEDGVSILICTKMPADGENMKSREKILSDGVVRSVRDYLETQGIQWRLPEDQNMISMGIETKCRRCAG